MKFISKLILTIIVVVAVLVGALAIFIATFDANDYKQQIISLVKDKTGRDLTIDGDLNLAMYPDIALELGKTRLSNAAGFKDSVFADVSAAKVSLKLLPLLKKKIEADEISLEGLQLNLQRKANGTSNWDDLAKGKASDTTEATSPTDNTESAPSKTVEELMNNFSIAGLNLKDANIHWIDEQAKQDIRLSPLNLSTGKIVPNTPLDIDLAVVMTQKNPATTLATEATTTLTFNKDTHSFALANLKLHANINPSQLGKSTVDINLAGDVKGNPQKINVAGLSLQSNISGDIIPEGAIKTDLKGNLDFDLNTQTLNLAGMKIENNVTGKPLAGGNLNAFISGNTKLDLSQQMLSIPDLKLNAKLAGGHLKSDGLAESSINGAAQFDLSKQLLNIADMKIITKVTGGYVKGGAANTTITGQTRFDLANQLLSINNMKLLADASGELLQGGQAKSDIAGDLQLNLAKSSIKSPALSINTHVQGGLVPGGNLTQTAKGTVDINWVNNTGAVNLANLLVKLAGMELKGSNVKLQPLAAKPNVSGQFQTNTFDLKSVMKTLGVTLPKTANPKALSSMQASFTVDANTDAVDISRLNLKLDKSTLTGSLGVANLSKPKGLPSLKPSLSINSINLDDYLAPTAPSTSAPKSGTTTASTSSSNTAELLPLETLRTLDINGTVKVGNMIVNKLKLSNINAKINAKNGLVVINPANASLYKGNYKGKITIDAKQATPTMTMRHELVGLRSEGLLFDLFQDKYISGGTKLITSLNSRGNTLDALLKNLSGDTSIAFNDGTIRDSKLAEKVSLAVKVFEKKEVQGDKSVVKFTGLSGDWKTNKGVFTTNNLSLLSPFFNIKGTGSADVAKQTLDMTLRIGPNTQLGDRPLFAPLRITGTFSDPKFSLDLKDLIKAVAAQDVVKLKAEAKAKLKAKEQELKLKFEKEKQAQQQKLKQKLANEKANAIKKLKAKTGDKLGNQLLNKMGVGEKKDPADPNATQAPKKQLEDKLKDKLNNKLKSLF